MAWLRRRIPQGEVRFSDLSAPDFPPAGLGVGREQLLAQLHARLPDGRWLRGVEVFRRLYAAAGWGALAAVSRWPVVRQLLEAGYGVFARQRLRWSGRCAAGCRRGAGT
jgi:predicted DCC family thiol-disulfide oxidoreductase YuxK